jgi:hypothetical protein
MNRKKLMTIVQCAKAPDAKQLANQVPMPYPLFSAGDTIFLTSRRKFGCHGTSKINIERTTLLSQRTAKRARLTGRQVQWAIRAEAQS